MNLVSNNKSWLFGTASLLLLIIGVAAVYVARQQSKSANDLAADLRGPDAHLRHEAARKLAKLGPDAKVAVPELAAALSDPDKRVRFHVAKALAEVGVEATSAAPTMIAALRNVDPDCRYYLVKALSKLDLGPSYVSAVPGLIQTLADENSKSRYYAAKCLKEIGPAAHAAATPLRNLSSDPDPEVRDAAASALKKVSKKS